MNSSKLSRLVPLALLTVTACGGGETDPGDDTTPPKVAVCGDAVLDPGETCDDGNVLDDEHCSADCSINLACPAGELVSRDLTVQDESDLLRASGCTSILGDLEIVMSTVADLGPLAALRSVGGNVVITDNAELLALGGLSGLTNVGGNLYVGSNAELPSLAGLEALTQVGGTLTVQDGVVTSLSALSALAQVGGLSLSGAFADLTGLEGLTEVTGRVGLYGTDTFTSLAGLENLQTVGGDLVLGDGLIDISALASLQTIGGAFELSETYVTSLSALSAVASVADVRIDDNVSLVALGGAFAQVTEISGDIVLSNNHNLLHLDGFDALTTLGGALWLSAVTVTDVTGFSNLKETCAAGPHVILDCLLLGSYELVDASGFDQLEAVHGRARIDGKELVDAFPALVTVDESLDIGSLSTTQLSGFNALVTVGGRLRFDTIYIEAISGFNALESTGDLLLDSLFEMTELDAFASLETVSGELRFDRCHAMTTLGTFGALSTVGGDLVINDNTNLNDLSAWSSVTSVGGDLVITTNPALATCEAEALRDAIGLENIALTTQIEDNDDAGTCL